MTRILYERFGTHLVWVRLFYVTGERGTRTSLFDQLKEAIRRGTQSFDLTGGEQLRDYLPVEAVASKLRQIGELADDGIVINLGSGSPISLRRLVEGIVREEESSIQLNWGRVPYSPDESMAFWADTGRLNALIGRGEGHGSCGSV
jgi:dTDP-6-deoxy-L-talose 4-dehydrogenase (NAD+)